MRRGIVVACLLAACGSGAAAELPQRPFETLLPWSLPRGEWEAGAGLVRRRGAHPPFFAEERDARRHEWRASLVEAALGLGGGGEAQLGFGVQRIEEEGGAEGAGVDDARVAFTYQLPVEKVGVALRFAVKLPNAPNRERLGTDETDVFLRGAVGQRRPRWGWAGNLGFGILGSPLEAGIQDDVLVLGAALWYETGAACGSLALLGEVTGFAASRFGNDFRLARLGARFGRRFPVDVSLRRGLTSESEDWGLETGVTLLLGAGGGR